MRQNFAYVQILAIALFLSACGKAEFGTNGGSSAAKSSVASSSSADENGDATGQIHDVGDLVDNPALADLYACGNKKEKKVLICHVPPGNSGAAHTICIGAPALDAHMALHEASDGAHDTLGECPAVAQVADQGSEGESSPGHSGNCNKKK